MFQQDYGYQQQTGGWYGTTTGPGTSGRMTEPPRIITSKDLLYIEDALSWLLTSSKKAFHFAQECQDDQLRQKFNAIGQAHHRHYQVLLRHLEYGANQNQAASYQQPSNTGTN